MENTGTIVNFCPNYTIYHCHTMDSLLDSATSYKAYIDRAVECGMKAIGFSEHGNVYHWFAKKQYAESKGLKFLHEIECYLTEGGRVRDNYHTILIAKNEEGLVELHRLISLTTKPDHFYYKPRLTFEEFLGISDNIIKISACLASPLWSFRKRLDEADENGEDTSQRRELYLKIAQHYDYYEIQYHKGDQEEYNKLLYELSKTFGKPLIAGTDTHSLDEYKAECRIVLKYGKTDGDWGDSENECDLTFKDYDSLCQMFKEQDALPEDVYLSAIEETNRMADSVEVIEIDTSIKYPILYKGQDEESIMMDRVMSMYHDKVEHGIIPADNPQYLENVKTEMEVLKKINMVGFMLGMSEMMVAMKQRGLYTSPCRGSVGGSTVAYITDIINVDPVKRHTVFSRFANEYRVEVGDIDTDWFKEDRQSVYDYLFDRFGIRNCAYILAVGTLADAAVIDTIGKAFRVRAEKLGEETEYSLEKIKDIKKEWADNRDKTREKYPDLFKYYDGLVGCVISQSQHPAGIVVSPVDLIDNYSVFEKDGVQIIPIDMEEIHDIGLVKYDILGLKNVGIIEKTCEYAGLPLPTESNIDWEDQDVFDSMVKHPVGIFQFESPFAFDTLKKYHANLKKKGIPFTIDDMTLCNACIRPSGASYRDDLIALKEHKNPSKMIDDLLANTHGHLVYQEQVIAFLQEICGLSGGEADNVRRAIGRKQADRLEAALPSILEGYCSKSDKPREVAEEEAKTFIKIIEDASSYMFGFNHATGYSMLGYLCAYYRHYYPLEFCTAFLNCTESESDFTAGTQLIRDLGYKIMPAKFGVSRSGFFFNNEDGAIYKSVDSIKELNKAVGEEMFALRDNHYESFIDVLYDLKEKTSLRSNQLDILIKLNFFSDFGEPNKLLYLASRFDRLSTRKSIRIDQLNELNIERDDLIKFSNKHTKTRIEELDIDRLIADRHIDPATLEKGHKRSGEWSTRKCTKLLGLSLEDDPSLLPYANKIVMGSFTEIDNRGLLKHYEETAQSIPASPATRMQWEQEYLGYIDYSDPTADPRLVMVMNLDTKFSPRFTGYCLKTGETKELKVHKKKYYKRPDIVTAFADAPFKDGDILYMKKCNLEPKSKWIEEIKDWAKDWSQMEWWIKDYMVV